MLWILILSISILYYLSLFISCMTRYKLTLYNYINRFSEIVVALDTGTDTNIDIGRSEVTWISFDVFPGMMQLVPLLILSIFEAISQGQLVKIRRNQGVEEPPTHPRPWLSPEQASADAVLGPRLLVKDSVTFRVRHVSLWVQPSEKSAPGDNLEQRQSNNLFPDRAGNLC